MCNSVIFLSHLQHSSYTGHHSFRETKENSNVMYVTEESHNNIYIIQVYSSKSDSSDTV